MSDETPQLGGDSEHDHAHDHAHDHGHHHHGHDPFHSHADHAPLNTDELDPANRALANALRLSFRVLFVAMLLLVAAYLFSGVRQIGENEIAVRLRFGEIAGSVIDPGRSFWYPEPIGQHIRIPTTVQRLTIDRAFWFHMRDPSLEYEKQPAGSLMPGRDGSLLTGDQNIVHLRCKVEYTITKDGAVDFVRNVGLADRDRDKDVIPPGTPHKSVPMVFADQIVRLATERAMVHAVGGVSADEFLKTGLATSRVQAEINQALRRAQTGITVTKVSLDERRPPKSVYAAFDAVTAAESDKAKAIEEARRAATEILQNAAGPGYRKLLAAIDAYDAAVDAGDAAAVAQTDAALARLFEAESVKGEAKELIRKANDYKTRIDKAVEAEANIYAKLLPQYRKNPSVVMDRLWRDALQEILGGSGVETFYFPADPDKHLVFEINRDPRVDRDRARRDLGSTRSTDPR